VYLLCRSQAVEGPACAMTGAAKLGTAKLGATRLGTSHNPIHECLFI
jgi:hypothetical protein